MADYEKYINALRKCAKEHENDKTFTGHIVVTDLCRDTANLLEELEQEPKWIPVSKKLPEPFTFVNATCRSLIDDREDWVIETLYSPIPKEVNEYGFSDWGNIPMLNCGEAEVIAWVERIIPQPYKTENEDQK
jgi:hypothetical protein